VARWLAPDAPDSVTVRAMRGPDQGAMMADELLQEGYDTLIAVGGDGTRRGISCDTNSTHS